MSRETNEPILGFCQEKRKKNSGSEGLTKENLLFYIVIIMLRVFRSI